MSLAETQQELPTIKCLPKVHLISRPVNLTDVPQRYMNPGELEALCAIIGYTNPKRVIEFGCNEGRTAKVILREIPKIQSYVGVDVLPGYKFGCRVQAREVPMVPGRYVVNDSRFQLIVKERGTFDLEPHELRNADVVFIDGDHSYDAVMHDTILATKIINPGGVIIWHDYHDKPTVDVKRALEYCYSLGRDIKHVADTWLAYERH